jgi:N-methylhydantoinase B
MNDAMQPPVDRIKVSVIGNRLDAISKEIGQTMLRTSRSPIFSEARDFVTAVFDSQLRLVAQTAYIPVIMGALPYAVKSIAQAFENNTEDGDIFILNDPYRGNNHPPDINVVKPVFHEGEVAFWAVSKGHHADVGGGGVAGYNPAARSVWEECIRIPPAKLYMAGKSNQALWDTVLLNVHLPFLVEGDLHCQVGAVTIGERSLKTLLEKYGRPTLEVAMDQIFDASEKQMRAAIESVPDGTYKAERLIDHDGVNKDRMIAVRLALNVAGSDITFDFTGSDEQAAGYVNSTLPNTASSAFLALFTSIGSGVRFNQGALRALHVVAPEGTVVNAREPAPVTGCTIASAQAIIEASWMALAQAVPERVDAGWARWCAPATMGFNPRTGTVVCAGGLRAPDPELHELVDPFTVLQYEFWPDSAGAGQWRGGMGTIYRWRIDADGIPAANFGGGVHEVTAPFGLEGGKPAPPHQLFIRQADGSTVNVDAESFYDLNKDDVYEIYESGGGGYGEPRFRSAETVRRDVIDGLVSVEKARSDYGVVLDAATLEIDSAATEALRAN